MDIEQEMKLWEERSKDEFGMTIKEIIENTNKFFAPELDEDGILTKNPIEHYAAMYAIDGHRKYIANSIKGILYNYDILGNYKNIKLLVEKLEKLI